LQVENIHREAITYRDMGIENGGVWREGDKALGTTTFIETNEKGTMGSEFTKCVHI
jgi:hypothetical protein